MLILDTNILIELAKGNKNVKGFIFNLVKESSNSVFITSLNYTEFIYGCLNKGAQKQGQAVNFLEQFTVLNTSKQSSLIAAKIKRELGKKGKLIPIFDILIASITIDQKAALVTFDEHFKHIDDLKVIYAAI